LCNPAESTDLGSHKVLRALRRRPPHRRPDASVRIGHLSFCYLSTFLLVSLSPPSLSRTAAVGEIHPNSDWHLRVFVG
jgi:hypothetical protein